MSVVGEGSVRVNLYWLKIAGVVLHTINIYLCKFPTTGHNAHPRWAVRNISEQDAEQTVAKANATTIIFFSILNSVFLNYAMLLYNWPIMATVRLSVFILSQLVCWFAAIAVYEFAYIRNREGLSVRITSLSEAKVVYGIYWMHHTKMWAYRLHEKYNSISQE